MTSGFDDLSQLAIEAFYRVGGVNQLANGLRKAKNGMTLSQALRQLATPMGLFLSCRKAIKAF